MTTMRDFTLRTEAQQPAAILLTPEGQAVPVNLPANPDNFAEYAAALLRCDLIEHVGLGDGTALWLDEDGLRRPFNELASRYAQLHAEAPLRFCVYGPVLITGDLGGHVATLPGRIYLAIMSATRRLA